MAKKLKKAPKKSKRVCSPSEETKEKLREKGRANFKKSPAYQIIGRAKELRQDSGFKMVTEPSKTKKVYNMTMPEAVKEATRQLKKERKI